MFGRPHAPDRVRVASPELAEALRAEQPDIEGVCAPTPEIDAVFTAMRERMNEDAETDHAGDVEVSLRRVPYERGPSEYKPPYDVLADLFELGQDGDEIDTEARRPLEDELVRRFVASPEAKALTDVQSCHFVMDFAADYCNATIATLGPRELREIVFDIIPRKVSIDASAASWIIEEKEERSQGRAQGAQEEPMTPVATAIRASAAIPEPDRPGPAAQFFPDRSGPVGRRSAKNYRTLEEQPMADSYSNRTISDETAPRIPAAAVGRGPEIEVAVAVKDDPSMLATLPNTPPVALIPGGLPIVVDGVVVDAVGVGGGTTVQDVDCAQAGPRALRAPGRIRQ